MQRSAGRCFLHEHPNTATSWQMPEVVAFASKPDVETAVCDMCAYGMQVRDGEGEAYARKSTRLMSNAPEVLNRLRKTCSNREVPNVAKPMPRAAKSVAIAHGATQANPSRWASLESPQREEPWQSSLTIRGGAARHRHANLTGGLAKKCQVYPPAFCRAVCEGTAAQKRLHMLGIRSEPLMSMEEMVAVMPVDAQHSGDPSRDLHEDDETIPRGTVAWDDQSGAWLKPELMAKARREEIAYFKDMGVHRKVPLSRCWEVTGQDPIAVRWVDINKGDTAHLDYRSRLVAK